MNPTLHRAIAACRALEGRPFDTEMVVFFELTRADQPGAYERLESALAILWNVGRDELEIYNVYSEAELLVSHAFGDASTGDMRLFETGVNGARIHYADPEHTLMLVRPETLARLLEAQRHLPLPVGEAVELSLDYPCGGPSPSFPEDYLSTHPALEREIEAEHKRGASLATLARRHHMSEFSVAKAIARANAHKAARA